MMPITTLKKIFKKNNELIIGLAWGLVCLALKNKSNKINDAKQQPDKRTDQNNSANGMNNLFCSPYKLPLPKQLEI